MRKCIKCNTEIRNNTHDYCYDCWLTLKSREENSKPQDSFEEDLNGNKIYTVYIMFYEEKQKIGYTNDLGSRYLEIKRIFPENKLVYFREFTKESEAREFESWLKTLPERKLMKFISTFQNKVKKLEIY